MVAELENTTALPLAEINGECDHPLPGNHMARHDAAPKLGVCDFSHRLSDRLEERASGLDRRRLANGWLPEVDRGLLVDDLLVNLK